MHSGLANLFTLAPISYEPEIPIKLLLPIGPGDGFDCWQEIILVVITFQPCFHSVQLLKTLCHMEGKTRDLGINHEARDSGNFISMALPQNNPGYLLLLFLPLKEVLQVILEYMRHDIFCNSLFATFDQSIDITERAISNRKGL